jgi:hypothetical protein
VKADPEGSAFFCASARRCGVGDFLSPRLVGQRTDSVISAIPQSPPSVHTLVAANTLTGLIWPSRSPVTLSALPFQLESRIVQLKKEHPNCVAPKIRAKLQRLYREIQLLAISTVHAVPHRLGLDLVNGELRIGRRQFVRFSISSMAC